MSDRQNMALVINVSGGKDSTAMLEVICARYPNVKKYAVMADTGFEHTDAIEWASAITARYGLKLHVVRNPNKDFVSMIEKRHASRPDVAPFPSSSTRQCTSDLKRDPIATWIRQNVKESVVINCMGLRAEESSSRAKRPVLSRNARLSTARRTVWEWLPIHKMMLDEVLAMHREKNLPLHPVYVWEGGYLTRFSCRLCVMMRDEEIRSVYVHDREAFNIMAALEESTGYTMKNGKSLIQIVGLQQSTFAAPADLSECCA